ncbi:MAG: hypothetical protein P4M11_02415 [Candidatus Pacebacteria bacterium]|nr:hypothetical protein [Candidatus Paceibacterota bacterium]
MPPASLVACLKNLMMISSFCTPERSTRYYPSPFTVDRLALVNERNMRDGLDSELPRHFSAVVHIHLDERDLALGLLDVLLDYRSQSPAGAAPPIAKMMHADQYFA